MTRDEALALVREYVKNEGLVRHMLSVEAAMRFYAEKFAEDVERWGLIGLLHDFDWEIHPTLEEHPQAGAPMLRERGGTCTPRCAVASATRAPRELPTIARGGAAFAVTSACATTASKSSRSNDGTFRSGAFSSMPCGASSGRSAVIFALFGEEAKPWK